MPLLPGCLSKQDSAVLAFAAAHHLQGQVAERVHSELGCDQTRYYQLLTALLDRPEALEAAPDLIGRLRELRDRRAGWRRGGRWPGLVTAASEAGR